MNYIHSDKFKTDFISVDLLSQMSPTSVAEQALLPFVLLRGTDRLPDTRAMSQELEMLYGSRITPSVSRIGSVQSFGFSSYPLSMRYTDGVDVSSEILSLIGELLSKPVIINGNLSEEYTESEKRIMIDRIRAQKNDKWSYSIMRCNQIMSDGGSSYIPETGTEEQVADVSARSLANRLFTAVSELRTEIWYIGAADIETVADRIRGTFPLSGRKKPTALCTERLPFRGEMLSVTETDRISQSRLCLGYRAKYGTETQELPAYIMFSEILSGSPISKLFIGVRERLSLCYDCSAMSDINRGVMIISSGIESANAEKAEVAINEQLDAIKGCEISDIEFNAALRSVTNSVRAVYDDAGAVKSWYLRRGLFSRICDPDEFLKQVSAVTRDDIANIARGMIPDTRYLLKAEAENNDV